MGTAREGHLEGTGKHVEHSQGKFQETDGENIRILSSLQETDEELLGQQARERKAQTPGLWSDYL